MAAPNDRYRHSGIRARFLRGHSDHECRCAKARRL